MESMFIGAAAGVALAAIVISVTLYVRAERRRRARQAAIQEILELATSAMRAELGKLGVTARAIPVDSPEGQAILAQLEAACGCPDHEEQRRIRHAEQQMRGEK